MSELTCHPDFPKGTRVINIRPESSYYGQRGVVYGGRLNSTGSCVLVLVKWDKTEEALAYIANRLTIAPKNEGDYKVAENVVRGKRISVHEVPAQSKRPRPTLFKLYADKSK